MDYLPEKLLSKKNIITFLLLAVIAAAIPVGVRLVQTQQLLRSQATVSGNEVTFPGLRQDEAGNYITNNNQVQIRFESPFGPPGSPVRTQ